VTAFFDDAVLQYPGLEPAILEKDIRGIDLAAQQAIHHPLELGLVKARRVE
jgi:hypothetical protein